MFKLFNKKCCCVLFVNIIIIFINIICIWSAKYLLPKYEASIYNVEIIYWMFEFTVKWVYSERQTSNLYWLSTSSKSHKNCPWLWLVQHHTVIHKLNEPGWMVNRKIFKLTKSSSSNWMRETWNWKSEKLLYETFTVLFCPDFDVQYIYV